MKKYCINTLLSSAVICLCGIGCSQAPRVTGNLNADTLLVTYRCWSNQPDNREETDTVITGPDRSFSIDFPDRKAAYSVEISTLQKIRSIRFLSVPGEQAVLNGWKNKITEGSDFYLRWGTLQEELDSLKMEIWRCGWASTAAAKDPSQHYRLKQITDSADMFHERLTQTVFDYIQRNPKDPISILAIDYLQGEDKEKAFNQLDESVREGALAPYALNHINNYKKRAEQEQRMEERRLKDETPIRERAEKIYAATGKKTLATGDPVPNLPVTDINGKEVGLTSFKGKYILIDFWATWCAACVQQSPYFEKLAEKLKDKKIVFISLSMDENRAQWAKMVKSKGWGGLQLYAGGSRETLEKLFSLRTIPRFILIDKEGKLLNDKVGYPSDKKTEPELRALKGI